LTYFQKASGIKDGSGYWQMNNFLETITGHHKIKNFSQIKIKAFHRRNGPLRINDNLARYKSFQGYH
jgi:hypothetical protein